ncbi:MAG: 1-phosphofructokinase family hexose kinase [Sphingobacteriales bacterium]|nr:MAG: 1-phosphofructokinase family hexose kinase [Sphingobacteriales bacterium]
MKNIVTITFNPAIDKTISVERLIATHKMKTNEPIYFAGGGGVNVSRAIQNLGYSSRAIYFEGGKTGAFFSTILAATKVDAISIGISGDTRENFIVKEMLTGKQFRFGLPGPMITATEISSLLHNLTLMKRIDYLVVSGSLTPFIPSNIFVQLKEIADLKRAKLVVDTSGDALRSALDCNPFLIKPSLRELAHVAGKKRINVTSAIHIAKDMALSGKCEVVVISMGNLGAMLITADLVVKVTAPKVQVISTVGAGDSMLAGILISTLQRSTMQ